MLVIAVRNHLSPIGDIVMDDRQEVKSLKKALRVLKVMNQKGDATVSDIAVAIGAAHVGGDRIDDDQAYRSHLPHQLFEQVDVGLE